MEFEWGKCQPFHRFDEPALFGPIDEFRLVAEPRREIGRRFEQLSLSLGHAYFAGMEFSS